MLIHPCRFDLMAKYLYIKAKDKELKTDFFKELYHKHFITFNNCKEYPDLTRGEKGLTKNNINDFIKSFDNLIDNMKENGFDDKYPIPLGKNGVIVNGAHRLMTGYYYNIPAKIGVVDENGNTGYNYYFFLNRQGNPKLDSLYADTMALEYIKHNKDIRTMVIYPIAFDMSKMNSLVNIIKDYGYIYYHKQVDLNETGVNNLIKEMYRGEEWIGGLWPLGLSPGGKAIRCVGHNPTMYISIAMNDLSKCVEMKERCRKIFNMGKHSLHVSDFSSDSWRISSALLNKNSVHYLNNGTNDISNKNKNLLNKYFKQEIDEDYCLTSSLILEMYGLREANDIDYLHKDNKNLDGFGLHDGEWLNYYGKSKDDIIYNPSNHFYVNGVKFASLNVIKEMKRNRNEKKDRIDLELINKISI